MTARIETEALQALEKLRAVATNEDLDEEGRYFADCCRDLTQCRHGETGEYRSSEDGRAIAILWNLWRSGAIQRHAAEVQESRLVIDHLGDLVAHFAAQAEHWRACAVGHLPQVTELKAEIAALKADNALLREHIAGRVYDC